MKGNVANYFCTPTIIILYAIMMKRPTIEERKDGCIPRLIGYFYQVPALPSLVVIDIDSYPGGGRSVDITTAEGLMNKDPRVPGEDTD